MNNTCPKCHVELPNTWKSGSACENCSVKINLIIYETGGKGHSYSEVVTNAIEKPQQLLGVLSEKLIADSDELCMICFQPFKKSLKSCPNLMELSIEYALDSWQTCGLIKRNRLIDFWDRNEKCFRHVISEKKIKVPQEIQELLNKNIITKEF